MELQIDFDLGTPQLISNDKTLQIITSKDSSTNTNSSINNKYTLSFSR